MGCYGRQEILEKIGDCLWENLGKDWRKCGVEEVISKKVVNKIRKNITTNLDKGD